MAGSRRGNLTSSTAPDETGAWKTTLYVYDHDPSTGSGRLVKAVVPVTGATSCVFDLRYDPLGRLYRIDEAGAGRTTFLHDGDAHHRERVEQNESCGIECQTRGPEQWADDK